MGLTTSKLSGFKTIQIPNKGEIKGLILEDSETNLVKAHRYTGVPYALPPVGENRWKKPQALPTDFQYDFDGRQYTNFGPICLQPTNYSPDISPSPPKVTRTQSEDCLLLNIWVPPTQPPPQGFPVFFYIHGGWLQVGHPNQDAMKDPSDLISPISEGGAGLNAIVVAPGYRLNIFGFLATKELKEESQDSTCGNYGFWDQRSALEWVFENISHFKGNPDNISVGGLSAGAHSTHSQLLYEYIKSKEEETFMPIIKRLFLQSNAVCLPSKTLTEVASINQFGEICSKLGIQEDLKNEEKLEELRKVDGQKIVDLLPALEHHTFRAVDDESEKGFVRSSWIEQTKSGEFGRWCKAKGIKMVIGETSDEQTLYRIINSPTGPDYEASLLNQVHNYYPLEVSKALMSCHPPPEAASEREKAALRLGKIASDSQVHAAERCLVDWLKLGGLTNQDILRYRVSFRSPILETYTPKWMGVSHSFDDSLWWFVVRQRGGLASASKEAREIEKLFKTWLEPLAKFFEGGDSAEEAAKLWYGGKDVKEVEGNWIRCLEKDGTISVRSDEWREEREIVIRVIKSFKG